MKTTEEITAILAQLGDGDSSTRDRLVAAIYKELKRLAAGQMRNERPNHTLQPTALAHEACIRLLQQGGGWKDREHLFRSAAKIMRQILTDYARNKQARKRGGEQICVAMSDLGEVPESWKMLALDDVLALDQLLDKLKDKDARLCLIVELRFFAGMNEDEVAEALKITTRTVRRDWEIARAWLYGQMKANRS